MTAQLRLFALAIACLFAGVATAEEVASADAEQASTNAAQIVSPQVIAAQAQSESRPEAKHRDGFFSGGLLEGTLLDHYSHGAHKVVNSSLSFIGVRYRFGGNSPETGFDCSGLVRRVFGDALGMELPRRAVEIAQLGREISSANLQPGDLVFFNTLRSTFSHVGIYLGNNRFLHAPSSGGRVRVDDLSQPYWVRHFNGARRIVEKVAHRLTSN